MREPTHCKSPEINLTKRKAGLNSGFMDTICEYLHLFLQWELTEHLLSLWPRVLVSLGLSLQLGKCTSQIMSSRWRIFAWERRASGLRACGPAVLS